MRFVDLLKSTVLLSGAAATLLALITVVQANALADDLLVLVAAGWWAVATLAGAWLGRRTEPTPAVERALRDARTAIQLPELRPGRVLLARLWPLLLATLGSAGLSLLWPQVAGVAAGFAMIWALSWRHQDAAVTAVEERDGVTFFIDGGKATGPLRLMRTPGLRRDLPPVSHGT
jgi:hypothetical protein